MATPTPGPGDQQPGETAKAFRAFRLYLEAGPGRTAAQVGAQLGHRSSAQSERWCSRWSWRDRVKGYEAKAISTRDDAHLSAIARRSQRQAELAQLYQEAGALLPREMLRRRQAGELDLRALDSKELAHLVSAAARAHHRSVVTERLALGMTTDQEGEPLPRAQAEEVARRMTPEELNEKLAGVDDLAERRAAKAQA